MSPKDTDQHVKVFRTILLGQNPQLQLEEYPRLFPFTNSKVADLVIFHHQLYVTHLACLELHNLNRKVIGNAKG